MRRIPIIVLTCFTIFFMLTGCTKKTECVVCHLIKECQKVTIVYGEKETEEYVCNECYALLGPFVELAGGHIK